MKITMLVNHRWSISRYMKPCPLSFMSKNQGSSSSFDFAPLLKVQNFASTMTLGGSGLLAETHPG